MSWPRTHWPKIALDGLDDRPRVEPPGRRQRAVERRDERHLVLEEVGDPDRQDEVAEDEPEQAAGAGDERQQERQVETASARPALADPGDRRRRSSRGSRPGSGAARRSRPSRWSCASRSAASFGKSATNRRISLTSGVRVSARNSTNADDPDDVDDQDRERPADAAAHQPADRRIEQVDEQQAEDERPDAVAGHPEQRARR